MAAHLLQLICHIVETCPKYEHRAKFTDLLDTLQQLVVRRILSTDVRTGIEYDYASLCLQIRHTYLHTPSIRVLHDPMLQDRELIHIRDRRLRFARFFGSLFEVTSLYLESNLDGTFEECVREALVAGDAEALLVMCVAAGRPVDVDGMCMIVTQAGEQLWSYIDTMEDWIMTDPTPQQQARLEGWRSSDNSNSQPFTSPPEWMLPDRYKVQANSKLRLKLMDNLYKKGYDWFH
ncbi:hypothetical protein DFQ28_007773 [Apophysomyces sp. BC1034]|nr:hypothetical protein DFQ29_007014 [Apophysomyces sp. BC1021]KAG0186442.1 hypothetical protein DFQ28_007773 [Apophysomyces sp. BC1034]